MTINTTKTRRDKDAKASDVGAFNSFYQKLTTSSVAVPLLPVDSSCVITETQNCIEDGICDIKAHKKKERRALIIKVPSIHLTSFSLDSCVDCAWSSIQDWLSLYWRQNVYGRRDITCLYYFPLPSLDL